MRRIIMEHPDELLRNLSYTKAIIMTYKPDNKVFGFDTLMYYITKSEYKGIPIILCFTNSDIRKHTVSYDRVCPKCTECCKVVTTLPNGKLQVNIVVGDKCYHLQFTKHAFDRTICNRSIKIIQLLEHIFIQTDTSLEKYNAKIYSNYTSHQDVVSMVVYDGAFDKHYFYSKSDLLEVAPCKPFYIASQAYEDSLCTRAIVSTYVKYPEIFTILNKTIN